MNKNSGFILPRELIQGKSDLFEEMLERALPKWNIQYDIPSGCYHIVLKHGTRCIRKDIAISDEMAKQFFKIESMPSGDLAVTIEPDNLALMFNRMIADAMIEMGQQMLELDPNKVGTWNEYWKAQMLQAIVGED